MLTTHATLSILSWTGSIASVAGAYLIATKNPRGFYVFVVADALLAGIQISARIWSQVALLGAYFVMNVIGIINHRRSLPPRKFLF
jgi:glutamate mutase epsilon subunit